MTRRVRRSASSTVQSAARFVPPDCDWIVSTDWSCNGRSVTPGTELKIAGEPGRYAFVKHVRRPSGVEWVDVIGGRTGETAFRSFRPDRVATVHRVTKRRAA